MFVPPDSEDTVLWRFLDFTKLASLLHRKALYFVRSDRLADPFEGSYPRGNTLLKEAMLRELKLNIGEKADTALRSIENMRRIVRLWTYLSSWHMNEHESAAMWKVYTTTPEAVAIRSTYKSLREVLPAGTHIGKVSYIDFEKQVIPEANVLYPFMYKRMSYSYERELRALEFDATDENGNPQTDASRLPTGKYIPVDVNTLVQSIYVAPGAPTWFREVVADLCSKYGLQRGVVQSSIDGEPFY
jgi:hypothetical protein